MMLWQKIWADYRQHPGRTLLALLNLAVGVFTVGTLFGMIDLQWAQMDAAHQQARPSQINLLLRETADSAWLTELLNQPGVAGVDALTPLTVRFQTASDTDERSATLMLRPPPAAQHFDRTTLTDGTWPGDGQIAIERLSVATTGLKIGDPVQLFTPGGKQTVTISGIVRHPFVKPPQFGGPVHFFADVAHAPAFGAASHGFRQLLVQIRPPYSVDEARHIARQLRDFFANKKIHVNATLLQDPERHWGRPFIDGVNGVLQVMALAALALADVLIFNTVSAHIAQQTDQIGVMKALGARRSTIARFYVWEIWLLALAALLCAVPAALVAAYFSACRVLALFNIDGHWAVSWRAVAWMVGGGLLIPTLAAAWPIERGVSMTVRAALNSYGLGGDFSGNRFDRWLERRAARCLPTLYAAALGNLFRRKLRFWLTQSVLVLSCVTFLVLMALIASLNLTLDNELARSRYTVRLGFNPDQAAATITTLAQQNPATQHVELWQRLPIELDNHGVALRQTGSLGLQLLALPPGAGLYQPKIEAGRWLQTDDDGRHVLVLNADTAALNGIQTGDWLDLQLGGVQQSWQVVGLYRWLAGAGFAIEPVYAPLATVQALTQRKDTASFALLAADRATRDDERAYLQALKQTFQDHGIALDVFSTVARLEQREFARNQFRPVLGTLFGLAILIATVGAMGLSGTLAISVLQRTRELGVLRAIGATDGIIFRLVSLEGLLHGLCAWGFSVPLAYCAAEPLAEQLGRTLLGIQLDYAFDSAAASYGLLAVLAVAWLAAYGPARQAARLSVRECLAK